MTGYTKFKSSNINEQPPSSDSNQAIEKNQDEPSSDGNTQFGAPKLQRNSSVSSSTPSVQMRRAFSMRRSSSVSERYCRIHDQRVALASPMDVDEIEQEMENYYNGSVKERKSGSKRIWKVCKRVFGF